MLARAPTKHGAPKLTIVEGPMMLYLALAIAGLAVAAMYVAYHRSRRDGSAGPGAFGDGDLR